MRRTPRTPTIDMMPMMGLCTMLIPMLLLATPPAIATIETSPPFARGHPEADQVLVPRLTLTREGVQQQRRGVDSLDGTAPTSHAGRPL
jgi:hypothetical protein